MVDSPLGRRWSLAGSTLVTALFCLFFVFAQAPWAVTASTVGISLSATVSGLGPSIGSKSATNLKSSRRQCGQSCTAGLPRSSGHRVRIQRTALSGRFSLTQCFSVRGTACGIASGLSRVYVVSASDTHFDPNPTLFLQRRHDRPHARRNAAHDQPCLPRLRKHRHLHRRCHLRPLPQRRLRRKKRRARHRPLMQMHILFNPILSPSRLLLNPSIIIFASHCTSSHPLHLLCFHLLLYATNCV